jgi:hypothetical protein
LPLIAVVTFITPKHEDGKVKLRKDVFGDQDPIGQRLTFDFQERQETKNYQALA